MKKASQLKSKFPAVPSAQSVADPFALAKQYLMFFIFPKSRSASFELVLGAARGAHYFSEEIWNKKPAYFCGLRIEGGADASRALFILKQILLWKGILVLIDGSVASYQAQCQACSTLECYDDSLKCDNHLAHCLRQVGGPGSPDIDAPVERLILPCLRVWQRQYMLDSYRPVPLEDQVQAAAVNIGCYWCPHFDKSHTRLTGAGGAERDVGPPVISKANKDE